MYKGIGYFIPSFNNGITIVMILISLLLLFNAFLSFKYLQRDFYIFLIAFIVLFLFSIFLNEHVNFSLSILGFLDILNIFSCIAILNEVNVRNLFPFLYKRVLKFCKIFLIFQIPVSIHQYLRYGANDFVSGTLGSGGSGILTCMCIISVFLLIKSSEKFERSTKEFKFNLKKIVLFSIGLIPIFLNETKVSILLLPLMFIGLAQFDKVKSFLGPIILGVAFLFVYSNFYSNDATSSYSFSDIFSKDFIDNYMLGELSDADGDFRDIPRFTKIFYAIKEFTNDIQSILVGNDYGAFKGGTAVAKSQFSKKFEWMLVGSRPLIFNLFIMGGIIFSTLFIAFVIKIIFKKVEHSKTKIGTKLFFTGLFIVLLFYNDSLLFQGFSCMFVISLYCVKKIDIHKLKYAK